MWDIGEPKNYGGILMNKKNIIASNLNDNVFNSLAKMPAEITDSIANYLTSKSEDDYKSLEIALKAYGYTMEQFVSLAYGSESFIRSYRDTKALSAKVDVIVNSTEFSDAEKLEELDKVHEQEVDQQDKGESFFVKENALLIACMIGTAISAGLFVGFVQNKKVVGAAIAGVTTAAGAVATGTQKIHTRKKKAK